MIKKMRESKMIDFDIVFFSAFIFVGIIFILFINGKFNFSITDIHAETIPKETITNSNTLGEISGTIESSVSFSNGGLINTTYGIGNTPVYTTVQITDYILGKGYELISILQVLAQPLCVIVFIIGCGKALIEAFNKTAGSGLLTMAFSGLAYAAILYASNIVNAFPSFAAS
jgi:hypothetical protein